MAEAGLTQYGHETWDRGGSRWVQHWPMMVSVGAPLTAIAITEHSIRTQCAQAEIVCR
jgi:hypothetical protein